MFKVSRASLHLLTGQTVFSKTVFSIARSTFRMYSVMAIFIPSIVWGLFEYTVSGAQTLFDNPVQLVLLKYTVKMQFTLEHIVKVQGI